MYQNRVVVLIDMDCFYCQVEEKLNPELSGKPIAVVQYNPWKGGGIIAVNYVARNQGVTRHMRGDEAKEKCPEIELPSVPCVRGKADISKYRDAGKEVAKILQRFTPLLERASIDEAYLDITEPVQNRLKNTSPSSITLDQMPNTFALGYEEFSQFVDDVNGYVNEDIDFDLEHARMLLVGALIVSEIRKAVFDETGFTCSAGISHNKILAKLVCGMNKPNKQTVLPKHSVNILYKTLPVKKVKHLGGKFGDNVCEQLSISKMAELQRFSEKELQAKFDEKNGTWLYNIARGIDLEPVQARFNPKSIGCCKQFKGKAALTQLGQMDKWLHDLGDEIDDRLEKDALENNRTPRQVVVSFSTQMPDGRDSSSSRSYNFTADDELCGQLFASKAFELILDTIDGGGGVRDTNPDRKLPMPIKFLGISVGKFEDNDTKKTRNIKDFFAAGPSKETKPKMDIDMTKNIEHKKNENKEYLMEKFLKSAEKVSKGNQNHNDVKDNEKENLDSTQEVIEAVLNKKESFFGKYLRQNEAKIEALKAIRERPITPVCKTEESEENSNDSNHSSSTINMEINKSISLFEEEPQEVDRIKSLRGLLQSTSKPPEEVECTECHKHIPIESIQTHADYHLALKLREEERIAVRNERTAERHERTVKVEKDKTKNPTEKVFKETKADTNTSIAGYLVKLSDVDTENCEKCGKKVPVDKYTEHLDFHEAQKLSRELNKKTVIVVSKVTPKKESNQSLKRKRKSLSPIKKPKLSCKPIQSFFNR